MIPGLRRAAARAIDGLAAARRPSGELPSYTARRPDMADARPYACCVYTSCFVIEGLAAFAEHPQAAALRRAAGAFLLAERNPDGSWSYEGRATSRVPPDLDDSACATAALLSLGQPPDLRFFRLLWENEAAPGGPYYTWAGVNQSGGLLARHLDALVNANVLLAAARAGQALPGAAAYLADQIAAGRLDTASDYCVEPHLLVYCLARAIAQVPPGGALEAHAPALADYAAGLPADTPLRAACAAAALLALGRPALAPARLRRLLAAQGPDGLWPIAAAHSGYPPWLDGAPALTTAIALDAIGRATSP